MIIIHDVPKISGKTGHVAQNMIVTQPVDSKNLNNDENKRNLNKNLTGKTGHVAPIVIVTQPAAEARKQTRELLDPPYR